MKRLKEKRAWVRAHLADNTSDAQLLTAFAAEFSMKEDKASAELKEIMAEDRATEEQFGDSSAQRLLALGQRLLDAMIQDKAHGPAQQMWKSIQSLKNLDKPQQVQIEIGAPKADVVRERIAKLLADKQVREQAEAAGVAHIVREQAEAAGVVTEDAWIGPNRTPNPIRRAAAESASEEPTESEEPAESAPTDAGPENIAAAHVAAVLGVK